MSIFSGGSVRYGPLWCFTHPGFEFRLKKMASISTLTRTFTKGKNGKHSNFRKEFREFLVYPNLPRCGVCGSTVGPVRKKLHGASSKLHVHGPPAKMEFSFVSPRFRQSAPLHSITKHAAAQPPGLPPMRPAVWHQLVGHPSQDMQGEVGTGAQQACTRAERGHSNWSKSRQQGMGRLQRGVGEDL